MFLWIMSFWQKESVLELMKYTEKPHHCNPPESKSQWSWWPSLSSSANWERDGNWRGTQSNLQVSTASDFDAEWRLDVLSSVIGHGSSLVNEPNDPPSVTWGLQDLRPHIPFTHVTSTILYISNPKPLLLPLRCIGSKSQDRNEVAIIKLHLPFEIHCLFLLWVSRLIFFLLHSQL